MRLWNIWDCIYESPVAGAMTISCRGYQVLVLVGSYLMGHRPTIVSEPMWTQRLIILEMGWAEWDYSQQSYWIHSGMMYLWKSFEIHKGPWNTFKKRLRTRASDHRRTVGDEVSLLEDPIIVLWGVIPEGYAEGKRLGIVYLLAEKICDVFVQVIFFFFFGCYVMFFMSYVV